MIKNSSIMLVFSKKDKLILCHNENANYICSPKDGAIAQLVEHRTENPGVPGSIPGGTTPRKSLAKARLFSLKGAAGVSLLTERRVPLNEKNVSWFPECGFFKRALRNHRRANKMSEEVIPGGTTLFKRRSRIVNDLRDFCF